MNLGIGIKRIRQQRNLTQSELAKKAGLHQHQIHLMEKGVQARKVNLDKCMKALNCSDTELIINCIDESQAIPGYEELVGSIRTMLLGCTKKYSEEVLEDKEV